MHDARLLFSGMLVAGLLAAATGHAADRPDSVTPSVTADACPPRADELWLVSTRQAGCLPGDGSHLDIRYCDSNAGWIESSLSEFLSREPLPTVVYVHGNRVDWCESQRLGRMAYQSLLRCGCDVPRLRFVIWSWPSDATHGPLRDVRRKADRADSEGTQLGWFLGQLPAETPLSLVGFSYGARVISGGLHVLGGGELYGFRLPDQAIATTPRVRAAYLAPALDNCWLCAGHCHGQSLVAVDRLLVLYNSCDPALMRFRITDPCSKPTALGFAGVSPQCLGEAASRVEQLDAASAVGKRHEEDPYWCIDCLVAPVCRIVLWHDETR
jgi:hypothetical protein